MTKKQHLRYRGKRRTVALLLMLAVSVGVVMLAGFWYRSARAAYLTPNDAVVPLIGAEALSVSEQDKTVYGVESAAQALDADGRAVGYVIVTTVRGYKSAIRIQSTFTADRQTLAAIRVLSQDETEYLGSRIQSAGFTALFEGRLAPVKLWGTATKGSPVDALSGSTISSQAVVDAVNNAYAYLQTAAVTG